MKMCSCLTVKTITIENHSRLEVQYAITEVAAKVSWTRESGITAGYLGTGVSANVTQSVESRDIPIQTDRLQAALKVVEHIVLSISCGDCMLFFLGHNGSGPKCLFIVFA